LPKHQLITKDIKIGDIQEIIPQADVILANYALSCANCSASRYETLEQGVLGHGFSEAILNNIIKDLNAELKDYSQNINKFGIHITEEAEEKLKQFAKEEKKEKWGIEIKQEFSEDDNKYIYDMDFLEEVGGNHIIINYKNKLTFYIDKKKQDSLKGIMINFIDNFYGTGFKIVNTSDRG